MSLIVAHAYPVNAGILGPEQVHRFKDDGLLTLPAFFSADEAAALTPAWHSLRNTAQRGEQGLTRKNQFIHGKLIPPLGSLYKHPALVALARQLLGDNIALYINRLLIKDESWSGPVGAHQDIVYFHGGLTKLSIFVPLTPMNRANGGLAFVTGSHKLGNLGERGTILLDHFPDMPVTTPDLRPGDICLMDILTWHLSEQATDPSERIALQIVYQPADDGSFYHGVTEPTLVHGQWMTRHFNAYGQGVWLHGQPKPRKSA